MDLGYCAKGESSDTGADIEYPAKADGPDDTTIGHTLDPKGESKASPCTDSVPCGLPEEDGDGASCKAGDGGGEYEHASDCFGRRIDCGEDAKLEDKDETCEGECVEAD